jgi:hypothetical protein
MLMESMTYQINSFQTMAGPVHHVITRKLLGTDSKALGALLAKVAKIREYQARPEECRCAWDIQLWDERQAS